MHTQHNAGNCDVCAARAEYDGVGATPPLGLGHSTRFDFEAFLLRRGFKHAEGNLAHMSLSSLGGYVAVYVRGSQGISITIFTNTSLSLPRPLPHYEVNPQTKTFGWFDAGPLNSLHRDLEWQQIPKDEARADAVLNMLAQTSRFESTTPHEFSTWGGQFGKGVRARSNAMLGFTEFCRAMQRQGYSVSVDANAFLGNRAYIIPEHLVKIEFHMPPDDKIQTTYFDDRAEHDRAFYENALNQIFRGAVMLSFTRGVKPEPESPKGDC